ncbi:hypothetical protein LTR56_009898 [Elasticomyces elasticus]|nr:hypothetical protein LTR56_009898 [Elasticomyces elasticus]KAK3659214.1 hypothetical protein LTR22_008677 [Elasticomyces elasticus]KAK4923110.1 hypothetical protein LTR49_009578 [Elasticomyces elasticus]KAK5761494.1 hypothetical protein LTS12_008286 [Elasticomyces elasticus]
MATQISSAIAGADRDVKKPKAPVRRRPPPPAVKKVEIPIIDKSSEASDEDYSSSAPPYTTETPVEPQLPTPPETQLPVTPEKVETKAPTDEDTVESKEVPTEAFESLRVDEKVDEQGMGSHSENRFYVNNGLANFLDNQLFSGDPTGLETVPDLIRRLQNNICAEPVKIRVSRDLDVEPAIAEETALCVVSRIFARDFSKEWEFARFYEAEEEDRQYSFFDSPPNVVETFLYWLINRSIPAQADFNSKDLVTKPSYQLLLAKAYAFAEDKRIKEMMNDVMPAFRQTLVHTRLSQEMLQNVLKIATKESVLRLVVLEEALRLEDDEVKMIKNVNKRWMFGIDADIKYARERYLEWCQGEELEYLVELDPPPAPPRPTKKRERRFSTESVDPNLIPLLSVRKPARPLRAGSPPSATPSPSMSPGRFESVEPIFDRDHPGARSTSPDYVDAERTRYFEPGTFGERPPRPKRTKIDAPADMIGATRQLLHPDRSRYLKTPGPRDVDVSEPEYTGDYLTVVAPAHCECPWNGKHFSYPKVDGEEILRVCYKCYRYKKPIKGKKFAWRAYNRRWMWVPLNAQEGLGPADGDEVTGFR